MQGTQWHHSEHHLSKIDGNWDAAQRVHTVYPSGFHQDLPNQRLKIIEAGCKLIQNFTGAGLIIKSMLLVMLQGIDRHGVEHSRGSPQPPMPRILTL